MDGLDQFAKRAQRANVVPVVTTVSADLLTPLGVYLKLSLGSDHSFLFESVAGGEQLARYSFIGANPDSIVSGDDAYTRIVDNSGPRIEEIPVLKYLRDHFGKYYAVNDPELPSFLGGAVGYLGFSCTSWFEPKLRNTRNSDSSRPDSTFMFFRSVVAFDHARQLINIITLAFTEGTNGNREELEKLYLDAANKNNHIKSIIEDSGIPKPEIRGIANGNGVGSNWEREKFENAVRDIKEMIAAGECYQVVLSQRFTKRTMADPVAVYRAVRATNPSPYMFLIRLGGSSIVGASPEMLVRCKGKEIEYRPIAGTRPRGATPEEDIHLANEMAADEKEVSEHLMLVDLGRNDLGRVARFGTVHVKALMKVEKYSHVQHLVSSLSAELEDGRDRFDALASCFPAGTVSGAPKVRAIEIIKELEPTGRGIYSGAVGYFDYSGNMDTCIAIRTVFMKDGLAHVQAGAGIVADSVPEREYEETVNKAMALIRALELAEK